MKVALDDSSSDSVDVVSGVPQGSVLNSLLFVLYTREMFEVVENMCLITLTIPHWRRQ